jgi:hypothetical protein
MASEGILFGQSEPTSLMCEAVYDLRLTLSWRGGVNRVMEHDSEANSHRLREAMITALEAEVDLGTDDMTNARAAIEEAISLVSVAIFGTMPWIGVSDEGIVSLLWQCDDLGVFLCFSGDGTFAFSTKSGVDDHYCADYTERAVRDGIPESILSSIERLSDAVAIYRV